MATTTDELLSSLANDIMRGRPNAYHRLVVDGATPAETRERLDGVTPQHLLAIPVVNVPAGNAMLAGLWIWLDGLAECHDLVQPADDSEGTLAFWHAIMHRREGDFSNAKYWYARCRGHPARSCVGDGWEPNRFVDLVEDVHDRPGDRRHADAVRLQRAEWQALFDYCARAAAGRR